MLTLLYHNILTQPADYLPLASYQVTLAQFRQQITRLRSRLLDPRDVQEAILRGRRPDGVLITFDDGASGVLDASHALAEIGAVGLTFICPGALESGLWFYRLADLLVRSQAQNLCWEQTDFPLTTLAEKRAVYQKLSAPLFNLNPQARDSQIHTLTQALEPFEGQVNPALTIMSEADLHSAAATGAMIFANHSWSHPNLATQNDADLRHEIDAARTWLDQSALPTLPWFAFPRGAYNAASVERASQHYSVLFGMYAQESDRRVQPRVAINRLDQSPTRFRLKTALDGRLLGSIIQPLRASRTS